MIFSDGATNSIIGALRSRVEQARLGDLDLALEIVDLPEISLDATLRGIYVLAQFGDLSLDLGLLGDRLLAERTKLLQLGLHRGELGLHALGLVLVVLGLRGVVVVLDHVVLRLAEAEVAVAHVDVALQLREPRLQLGHLLGIRRERRVGLRERGAGALETALVDVLLGRRHRLAQRLELHVGELALVVLPAAVVVVHDHAHDHHEHEHRQPRKPFVQGADVVLVECP